MKPHKQILVVSTVLLLVALPFTTYASDLISAKSYIITDTKTGNAIMAENEADKRIPASLTKLVTAMVVMDAKPNLNKQITMAKSDQTLGQCGAGGGCIKSKAGVKFTLNDLFYAALLPSANNAASALSRSIGLTPAKFVARMNAKAKTLGAKNTHFYEPTGMGEKNYTTAADYSKIVTAAFSKYPYLKDVSETRSYDIVSTNNTDYNQTVKNGNKLLADDINILGAKNGYIGSISGYNYSALVTTKSGAQLSLVLLGEPHMYTAYADAESLIKLAESLRNLALK